MRNAKITALVAAFALAAGASAGASTLPTLRFVDLAPVKVRGAHFVPDEVVRVTLRAGDARLVRTTRTSAVGEFAVNFGPLQRKNLCSGLVAVVADGEKGDHAARRLRSPACPAMRNDR